MAKRFADQFSKNEGGQKTPQNQLSGA